MSNLPLKLNNRQKKIYEALIDIDQSLGRVYLGALQVLINENNPERIPQSAHSFREIANIISRKVGLPIEKKVDDKKERHSKKLAMALDPLGGVPHLQDIYKKWIETHNWFTSISHHGKIVELKEFKEKLDDFEELLAEFVFKPQILTIEELDKIIVQRDKNKVDVQYLKRLLSKNYQIYSYFFRKVDSSWLKLLQKNNFFKSIPEPISEGDYIRFPIWPESQYLARIAKEKPKDVMSIISECMLKKDSNPYVFEDLFEAAKNMPTDIGFKIIEKIKKEKWMENPYHFQLPHKLNEYLKKLLEDKKYKESLELISILLDVKLRRLPESEEYTHYRDVEPYIENYEYEEILKNIYSIPFPKLEAFIKLLVKILCKAISIELNIKKQRRVEITKDYSNIWRPAIENNVQNFNFQQAKVMLVINIRNLLERYIKYLKDQNKKYLNQKLEEVLTYNPTLFNT